MSYFQPTRASPPSRPVSIVDHALAADTSRVSISSTVENLGLTQDDIELIDAVIQRAGPSATTFLTVFKAYNDILAERGLDPHEVLYYGKLLKIGTLKGNDWGDKWTLVKTQLDQSLNLKESLAPTRKDPTTTHAYKGILKHGQEGSRSSYLASRRPRAPFASETKGVKSVAYTPDKHRESETSKDANITGHRAFRPPEHDARFANGRTHHQTPSDEESPRTAQQLAANARRTIALARERGGSVVNEDEAWHKIKMERDEKEADQYYNDRILERCWAVWRSGFDWIHTTHRQILEARDNLILRRYLQKWRIIWASRREWENLAIQFSNRKSSQRVLDLWNKKWKETKQLKWRQEMRSKLQVIRTRRETKICKDAWAKWRQSYRSHLSDQLYSERLILRSLSQWKSRLFGIFEMEIQADEFHDGVLQRVMHRCWLRWKASLEMRSTEHLMIDRVDRRIMRLALEKWQDTIRIRHKADALHNVWLMKRSLGQWKAARDRIKILEKRAIKHVSRQDAVLLRAIVKVWKAKERGNLLERVKLSRLVKSTWNVWRDRLQTIQRHERLAVDFAARRDTAIVQSAFIRWNDLRIMHLNMYSFAAQYHAAQLSYRIVLTWRIQLRERRKLLRLAKVADKFFAVRRAWRTWVVGVKLKLLEKRLRQSELRCVARTFQAWQQRTRRNTQLRIAEVEMQSRVEKRILGGALARWTNAVIKIKLTELEVTQKYDMSIQHIAFKKWRHVHSRHAEELSLMESYQLVKREELIRRLFSRWLALARAARHRRVALQEKEEQIRLAILNVAWEKWRDRFTTEKLRPTEHLVIAQTRQNKLFRAFGIWHSKTKLEISSLMSQSLQSLPAIRFHATRLKSKYFNMWRQAMPRALQMRAARERDKKAVLEKYTKLWVEALRTKLALKAVARARYLRLPTGTPRQSAITQRPTPFTPPSMRQRDDDEEDKTDDGKSDEGSLRTSSRPVGTSAGRYSYDFRRLKQGVRSVSPSKMPEQSPTRSPLPSSAPRYTRFKSPVQITENIGSSTSDNGRSRLWNELRQVQRKYATSPSPARDDNLS